MISITVTNVLRYILMGGCLLLIGGALDVMLEAHRFRVPPKYVRNEAIVYVLMLVFLIGEVQSRLGSSFSWRIPFGFFAVGFGFYAMIGMRRHYTYQRRLARHEHTAEAIAKAMLEKHRDR